MIVKRYDILNIVLLASAILIAIYVNFIPVNNEDLRRDDFYCQAVFKLETPNLNMPTIAGITVNGDKGVITFGGPVYKDNVFKASVNRRVEFNYVRGELSDDFKIKNVIKFEKDDITEDIESVILPGFFLTPGTTIYFRMERVKGGIFFIRDNSPMFYCAYR